MDSCGFYRFNYKRWIIHRSYIGYWWIRLENFIAWIKWIINTAKIWSERDLAAKNWYIINIFLNSIKIFKLLIILHKTVFNASISLVSRQFWTDNTQWYLRSKTRFLFGYNSIELWVVSPAPTFLIEKGTRLKRMTEGKRVSERERER